MASALPLSCAELRTWYEAEQLSVAAIAQRVGCSPATISNWLRRCAIPARSGRFTSVAIDPHELRRLYLDEALPLAVIAATFHVSVGTINNRLRAFGIPKRIDQSRARRTSSEANHGNHAQSPYRPPAKRPNESENLL